MIPKIIHFVWVGGNPKPQSVLKCIESWQKFCPDYEIREWNEYNFDINENQYCREAYHEKKYAFVSDYIRLKVLHTYGGIYMDTDVEVCKAFDALLKYDFFACLEYDKISLGTFGCIHNNEYISLLLDTYSKRKFYKSDGNIDTTTNLIAATNIAIKKFGVSFENQEYIIFGKNNIIFPSEYFIAKDYYTGEISRTNNTYAIHHYDGTWVDSYKRKIICSLGAYKIIKFHKSKNAKDDILPVLRDEFVIYDYCLHVIGEKYKIAIVKNKTVNT